MKGILKKDVFYPDQKDLNQSMKIGSPGWYQWLAENQSFRFESDQEKFSARKEVIRSGSYWYAYRRRKGRLRKVYLGKSSDLTLGTLIAAGQKFKELEEVEDGSPQKPSEDWYAPITIVQRDSSLKEETNKLLNPLSLQMRLIPPALSDTLVPRMHLIEKIREPITLISAPSGYGKTTLLSQWRSCQLGMNDEASSRGLTNVCWVSLGAGQRNVYMFWATIVAALQQIDDCIADTVSILLNSAVQQPIEFILSGLIHNLNLWMERRKGKKLAIIIDDYQWVSSPEVNATCQFFLDHLPPNVQVIMASQTQFPFNVQRWQARGIWVQLNVDDLRFSPEESQEWLTRSVSIPLTEREKLSLAVLAAGWAAGLNLLMLALKDQHDVHHFIATFDGYHPFLQTYFVDEILKKQPPEQQAFLLKTSILANLNGPLCDAITGQIGCETILQQLYQNNLFTTMVDKEKGWYRYHDLFAQALQHQLQQHAEEEIPELHRRAAVWYQEHGFYSEAISHLLQIEAWYELAQVIEQVVLDELRLGSDHRVLRWMQQLPDELFIRHSSLLITYIRLARPSLPEGQVDDFIQRIRARVEALPVANRSSIQQDVLSGLNEWENTAPKGRPILSPGPDASVMDQIGYQLDLQYQASCCLLRQGKNEERETALRQAIQSALTHGNVFVVLYSGGLLAQMISRQGGLREGERLAHEVLNYALSQNGKLAPCASIALSILGKISYTRNHLTQARQYIDEAVKLDPNPTSLNMVIYHNLLLAFLLNAQEDKIAARNSLQAALDLQPYASQVINAQDLKLCEALLSLQQGQTEMAEQILRQISDYPLPSSLAKDGLLKIAWAEIFLREKQFEEAERILTLPGWTSANTATFYVLPNHNLLLALVYWEQHKFVQARQEMVQIIRLASSEGIIRPFLDCGIRIIPLLDDFLKIKNLNVNYRQFVRQLISQFQTTNPEILLWFTEENIDYLSEQLSPREREVIKMLDKGLDNLSLARRLYVSESTLRTHLRNIYRKLGVHSRVAAIKKAQDLGFI